MPCGGISRRLPNFWGACFVPQACCCTIALTLTVRVVCCVCGRDHGYLYNGYLSFWMGSFAGDFVNSLMVTPYNFVTLVCASCANAYGGYGVYLSQRYVNYTGGLQLFNFTLNELPANGWFKDPKTSLVSVWPSPTQCEFIQVLMGLSQVIIYGDTTTGFEVMGLDAFTYQTGPTGSVPMPCYL